MLLQCRNQFRHQGGHHALLLLKALNALQELVILFAQHLCLVVVKDISLDLHCRNGVVKISYLVAVALHVGLEHLILLCKDLEVVILCNTILELLDGRKVPVNLVLERRDLGFKNTAAFLLLCFLLRAFLFDLNNVVLSPLEIALQLLFFLLILCLLEFLLYVQLLQLLLQQRDFGRPLHFLHLVLLLFVLELLLQQVQLVLETLLL
mmetsp:Transcript_35057/g.58738  ORF Transcript_35057/g.58738 Transcript_35057/m.58738 type:complete len:207 (-) Transcript_35057:1418-2038(-)